MMRIFNMTKNSLQFWVPGIFVLAILFCSCANTRQLTYMQGTFDTAALKAVNIPEPVIQKGDLLSIIVYSDNPMATALYNQSLITVNSASGGNSGGSGGGAAGGGESSGNGMTGSSPSTAGYLVDERGVIQFQGLGIIHVQGLTRAQLKDSLINMLTPFLKNPYCNVRFLNYRFTMLGEISHPGIFSIPGDHVNLLEAIGMAGDLTFYGRRDNVLIIREKNGIRDWKRLDLTKPDIMGSPYYYLQPNDVVYIEANKRKVVANDQVTTRNISIGATIVSTLAIIYSIFKK